MVAVLNYPAVSISDILSRFEEEADKTSSRDALVKLLRFVKKLFQKPQGGKIEVELLYKSESIAKYINRLHLPKDLKKLFFHTSHGGRVQFNGIKITTENTPLVNIELILKELRKNHQKAVAA